MEERLKENKEGVGKKTKNEKKKRGKEVKRNGNKM